MNDALNHGVQVYSKMAGYLEDYANGVTDTVRRFKA